MIHTTKHRYPCVAAYRESTDYEIISVFNDAARKAAYHGIVVARVSADVH